MREEERVHLHRAAAVAGALASVLALDAQALSMSRRAADELFARGAIATQ